MAAVFISYRRDDTAGYAGRLFDDLVRRLGESAVFMDVADIAPGSDWVETIDRAVSSCQVLLVLIGRNWLTNANDQRRGRLEDPQDFIRREVATALERNIPVVPVLVQGARMPTAEELPKDLQTLARRQAIELSDSRWDTDVARLEEAISSRSSSPRPDTRPPRQALSRRQLLAVLIAGLLVAVVIVAYKLASPRKDGVPKSGPQPTAPDAPHSSSSRREQPRTGSTSSTASAAGSGLAYALNLPAVAKVRVGKQDFQILAVRLEPRGGDSDLLSFLVRLTDRTGGGGDNFWDDSFRLVLADGRKDAPVSRLNLLVEPFAAREGEVRFEVPKSLSKVELEISKRDETTRIPIDLRDRKPIPQDGSVDRFGFKEKPLLVNTVPKLPAELSSGAEAHFDGITYKVLSATVDRYNVEKAALTIKIRCAVEKPASGVNFWDQNIRLVVDGVPRAPDERVNEAVYAGASKDANFVFLLGPRPETLKLTISLSGRTVEIPLDLPQTR